jgi:hypothetical protein
LGKEIYKVIPPAGDANEFFWTAVQQAGRFTLSPPSCPAFLVAAILFTGMMDVGAQEHSTGYDFRHLDRIREKFHEVFGSECTLRDETLVQRYTIAPDGELIMFVR